MVWEEARRMRVRSYFRVPTASQALGLLQHAGHIALSLEITGDWYDPPGGVLPELKDETVFCGSHAM